MRPPARRFALTAHVITSIGWIGAALSFLGIAGVGLSSQDAQTVRGAYLVMEPAARYVLVPLALASLVTGLIMSLGTEWGLFRHYWVVFKLLITVFCTVVLMIYLNTFREMARIAANPDVALERVRLERTNRPDVAPTLTSERWLFVIGVVALAIALLIVAAHLSGSHLGDHFGR